MSINDMSVFVFFAKVEEFERYVVHPDGEGCASESSESVVGDNYKLWVDADNSYAVMVLLAPDLKEQLKGLVAKLPNSLLNRTYLPLEISAMVKPDALKEVLPQILALIAKNLHKKISQASPKNVTLFVHWGDGNTYSIAETELKFCNYLKSSNNYKNWKAHSISSLRNEIFNVDNDKILVPTSQEALKALANKLTEISQDEILLSLKIVEAVKNDISVIGKESETKAQVVLLPILESGPINELVKVFKKAIQKIGIHVVDVSKRHSADAYPFFVDCYKNDVQRYGEESAIRPPKEFVLTFKLGENGDQNQSNLHELIGTVKKRIKVWQSCDSEFANGVPLRYLQDWCSGEFRRFLGLDPDAHGTTGEIDEKELETNPETGFNKLKKRFGNDFEARSKFWAQMYPEQIEMLKECLDESRALDARCVCFRENVVKPSKSNGYGAGFLSPTRKLIGLLIDDDADNVVGVLNRNAIYTLKPIQVSACNGNVVKLARKEFKDIQKRFETYDFALLDLRLADTAGNDPSGYYLISLIKQFFPNLPIIIYSRYDDMGHMSRAFKMGADWFIRKDEIEKLPRHLLSILSLRNWHKEWDAIKRLGLCNDPGVVCKNAKKKEDFEKEYKEERKYLTCKCLEKLPGRNIEVSPTGGGFSSSATFRARKWSEDKNEADKKGAKIYLQDPVIIKIDTAFNTMTEYERYFRFIRPYIANESGRVESKEITLDHNNSAITYTFAGKNDDSRMLDTMKNMLADDVRYMARCDYKKYEAVFDEIFNDILPKIHRVSPDNPNLESPISSYPNRIFGEKDWKDGGFIGNYLARIPLLRSVSVKEFVDQGAPGSVPFEMHGVATEGEQKVIETYEIKDPKSGNYEYSKLNVILKGDVVDHVARYRELKQGQTLWVKLLGKDKNDTLTMDSVILDKLIEMLYSKDCKNKDKDGNPTFYDGEKEQTFDLKHNSNTKEEQSRKTFCKLVKTLILGHTPDDGRDLTDLIFDSMVDSMYKTTCDVCAASDSNVRFKCKVGIVHGDLNYANIMVDSKKDGTIEDAKDVWLIDFARTRRDIIAHDFNVIFTATFSQLFNNDLWNDKGIDDNDATRYAARLTKIFPRLIKDAMFAESDEEPDYLYVMEDRRFTLFYKIFRRIRKAALSNDNMTEDMYTLTTALCCLYTFKVFLKYEKNIQGAAALLATAYICIKHLNEAVKS